MSSPSQLDLHPDADSLNAFVEQLLTEPERAQILTHLAGCARCREVIFVAQRAVYAMEPEFLVAAAAAPSVTLSPAPAPAPAPAQIQAVPRPWRAASIPAAALAAAIALSVFAYVAHTREASELAGTPRALPTRRRRFSRNLMHRKNQLRRNPLRPRMSGNRP